MNRRTSKSGGFTLVELMIVVAIIGVLAALAIFGVRRYLAAAKTSEAKNSVGAISRGAVLAFEREMNDSALLPEATDGSANRHLLCDSANPVPSNAAMVRGTKYQPDTANGQDFDSGSMIAGWRCLNFSVSNPMYYRLTYFKDAGYLSPALGADPPGTPGFEAAAQGDLDGDNLLSTFARVGQISVGNEVQVATQIFIDNEFE